MAITKAPSMKKIPAEKKYPSPGKSSTIKESNTYNPQPSICISEEFLPEIKSWSIDGEYDLRIKVKMTGIRTEDYGSEKGKVKGDFKITSIGLEKAE